jgi:hypothetical protein
MAGTGRACDTKNVLGLATALLGSLLVGGTVATGAAVLHVCAASWHANLSYRLLVKMTLWGGTAVLASAMLVKGA